MKPAIAEVPLKTWIMTRAIALGLSYNQVYHKLRTGAIKWPKVRLVNSRVILVKTPSATGSMSEEVLRG